MNLKIAFLALTAAAALLGAAVIGVPSSALKGGEALIYKSPAR